MSPEALVVLGPTVFVVCFFCLILVIMVIAWTFIFTRVAQKQKVAGRALAEDTQSFFARSAEELYPLTGGALEDISSQLEVNGRAVLGNVHYRGQLRSISQTGRGYVDFDLQLKFGKGIMRMRTTQHQLQLTFGGIGVTQVQASTGGQPFGVLVNEKEVSLRDLQGNALGCYHRSPLTAIGIAVEPARFNFKTYYGAVEIGGRTLAKLNRNPLILRPPSGTEIAPLFKEVAFDLSIDEEIWLLLLAGWEIYVKIIAR